MSQNDRPGGVAAETAGPAPAADEHRRGEPDQAMGTGHRAVGAGLEADEHGSRVVDGDGPDLVPDAIEAAKSSTRENRAPVDRELARARGVEWVSPTDLIARQSAALAGRGIDLQAELSRRTRTVAAASARTAVARVRGLPPLSAFGRSRATQSPSRAAVGMS